MLKLSNVQKVKRFLIFKKRYGCTWKFYKQNKFYEKSFFSGEVYFIAKRISQIKDIPLQRAKHNIKQAKELFNITPYDYYKNKYYNFTNYHLMETLYTPSDDTILSKMSEIVALRMGIDEEAAKSCILSVCEKYAISPITVIRQGFYKLDEELIKKRIAYDNGQEVSVKKIAQIKGVSEELAEKRLKELNDKFGIRTKKRIIKYWDMPNKKIFQILEKQDEVRLNRIIKWANEENLTVPEFYYRWILVKAVSGEIENEFWKELSLLHKDIKDINTFILTVEQRYFQNKYNDYKDKAILDNKVEFAKFFGETFGRKFWDSSTQPTYESFLEFFNNRKYPDIIIKPINSFKGKGIRKVIIDDMDPRKLFEELIGGGEPIIAEECIIQHRDMACFGGGAVNTIRIVTIYDYGKCNIIYAVVRIGKSSIVDNLHAGGFIARININTGIIEDNGYDTKGNEYIYDFCTNKKIKGSQIPYWEEVIKLVSDAGNRLNSVGFVGWDVAITEDGPVLIEGNSNCMVNMIEYSYKDKLHGHRHLFSRFLDESKEI